MKNESTLFTNEEIVDDFKVNNELSEESQRLANDATNNFFISLNNMYLEKVNIKYREN